VVEKKGSVARGDLDILDTLLALYVAAPVELALAALHPPLAPRRVSAIAAQQVAPVDSFWGLEINTEICFKNHQFALKENSMEK
jgi:hypothetical protein